MAVHLQRDLDSLKENILTLGGRVEDAINKAMRALDQRRPQLAEEVIDGDSEIDHREVEIEQECLKILALHQPVAGDLRFVVAALKVNNELERLGDQAANIAIRTRFLSDHDPIDVPVDLNRMVETIQSMVQGSLDALVNQDPDKAREVIELDDAVNEAHEKMFQELQSLMAENPDTIERAIHTLFVSRYLERMGDLTKNICEDVIFLAEGEVVRHQLANSREIEG